MWLSPLRRWRIINVRSCGMTSNVTSMRTDQTYVYWPDEAPMYDQTKLETISKDHSVDVVITHTAPSFCQEVQPILIQNWLVKDEDLLDDIKHERKVMDDIHSFLKEHGHPLQH